MNELTEPASAVADPPSLPIAGDTLVEDPLLDDDPLFDDDLLVEEVSIDGMCGVY
jgi:mycofactocin precursor